jgi:uncharacterized protein YrzB (UPF0473 family)
MKQDRFLTGILIGVVLLVVISVGLFMLRGGEPSYLDENTPEAVVLNYVLALQNRDYEKAYQYLPEEYEVQKKPSFTVFRSYFSNEQSTNTAIQVVSVETQDDLAWVMVETVQSSGGLFGGIYRSQQTAHLVMEDSGNWKIVSMPYPFWGWEWFDGVQTYR